MMKTIITIFIVIILVCSGCATIVSKSSYPIAINSNPTGAMVSIKNEKGEKIQTAITPATLILPAKSGYFTPAKYTFDFSKEGFSPYSTTMTAEMNWWYLGNVPFFCVVGLLIDPATGAMWKLDDNVSVSLHQEKVLTIPELIPEKSQNESENINEFNRKMTKLNESLAAGFITKDEYEAKRRQLVDTLFQHVN